MKKAILAIALLSLSCATVAMGQNQGVDRGGPNGGRGPNITAMVQRQVRHLTLLLDLTPGEQTQLSDLFSKTATSDETLFASMRAAQKSLRTAETNNDSAGIQSARTQIGTITGELTANRASRDAAMAQILTPDQLNKYKALRRDGRRGFGGPASAR